MGNGGKCPILVDFAPKCTFGRNWAPKGARPPHRRRGSAIWVSFGPESPIFMRIVKIHEISWNFMKFREISGKARRRGARKWKGWFGVRQVSIPGGDFYLKSANFHDFHEKVEFSWISWNFIIFTKTRLFAPKCTLGHLGSQNHQYSLCYGRISASGRKCALFREISHFLLIFTLFAKITFSWFSWFSWKKHDFSNLATGTGSEKCEKVHFHDFHEIFMKITKESGNFQNFQKFWQNNQENRGCWFCFVFQWKSMGFR